MQTDKSNASFSQSNSNRFKCSAWLKSQDRFCKRAITKADQDERDSLFVMLTVGGVYVDELVQKFVDLHFCRNWHRRGGKHAFIRNPDDGWQVFQKILQEDCSAEQGNFLANAPIPNRRLAGNGRSFSGSTTSNFNQASPASHSQMSPEIQQNPIFPMTDLPYPEAEIQRIPISPMGSWADSSHTPSSRASPSPATVPVTEVPRRSARIRAQQQLPLEVPRASALGSPSVTSASQVPTPRREVLPNTQRPSQATKRPAPTAPITPPASRNDLRRRGRIQEQIFATGSNTSLSGSMAPEDHLRTNEIKDQPYRQRNYSTAPRSSQAAGHFLTPRQLASRSSDNAEPAQSPLPSAHLSANGNTASKEIDLNEECIVCDEVFEHRDRVHRCNKCLHDLHLSCFADWLCASKKSQTCIFCRSELSDNEVLGVFDMIGGAEGRKYRGQYRLMKLSRTSS